MKPIACPKCQSNFEPVVSDSRFSCPTCKTVFEIYQKDGRNLARIVPTEIDEIDTITEQQVKCPYCRELILESASICKHCGHEILSEEEIESKTSRKNKIVYWLVGIFAIVLLICGLLCATWLKNTDFSIFPSIAQPTATIKSPTDEIVTLSDFRTVFEQDGFVFSKGKNDDGDACLSGTGYDNNILIVAEYDSDIVKNITLVANYGDLQNPDLIANLIYKVSNLMIPGWFEDNSDWIKDNLVPDSNVSAMYDENTSITLSLPEVKGMGLIAFGVFNH